MPNPKFSIVIPTRERHATLKYTLETCLAQEFDDYEIVVSDNFSSDATRHVVEALASPRIVYKRTSQPLCMQDNWNTAYGLARGDWVTFIGDDDGLTPFGLRQLDKALSRHDVKAARWHHAVYSWPDIIESSLANYMNFYLSREETVLESREVMKDVVAGKLSPGFLPNVYHGAVSRGVLEEIRKTSGSVFAGFHPDTYTSFGVAYYCGRHLSLTIPISVSGFSKQSNNIAFSFVRRKSPISSLQQQVNNEAGIRMHPWVADLPSLQAVIYDSFLLAKRDLFPDDPALSADRKLFAERIIRELPIDDLSEWPAAVAEVRRSVSDDHDLLVWFDGFIGTVRPTIRARDQFRPKTLGFDERTRQLHLDTARCGAFNVSDAARLTAGILNYDDETQLKIVSRPNRAGRRALAEIGPLVARLLKKVRLGRPQFDKTGARGLDHTT